MDKPRSVDHLVLPTADLEAARTRLALLGFTVAPEARHPFGTANACVFFADGTYLEPLSVAQRELCEHAAIDGNVFVMRDQAYRFRRGEEGFSALVMGTDKAEEDRRQFLKAGISAGLNLEFSRPFETPDGARSMAGFELAFAADLRAPDVFFFTCERKNAPDVDRSVLETHENGVTGIRQVVLSEQNPSDFQYLLQQVVGQREVNAHSFGVDLAAANADVVALNSAGLKGFFGVAGGTHARGLRLRGIVFATADLDAMEQRLKDREIAYAFIAGRLVVAEAAGQGAFFAFEQGS
ncbi:VOC family protein [Hoeflea poritis]|uniref:VOC family protein n=1 Tax=Hoeflea poritis TaxID=2993659 RepID=A0ABT4VGH6_9HYPH|nr:VOC family protein [Hoeflea poritis]MDA4843714.1 VOC family protein [Hoeflea poritis]